MLWPLLSNKVEPIQQSAIIALVRVISLEEEFEYMKVAKDSKATGQILKTEALDNEAVV